MHSTFWIFRKLKLVSSCGKRREEGGRGEERGKRGRGGGRRGKGKCVEQRKEAAVN